MFSEARDLEKIKVRDLRWVNCVVMNGLGRSPRPVPKRSRDSVVPGGFVFKARQGRAYSLYVTLGVTPKTEP